MTGYVSTLTLSQFRAYHHLRLQDLRPGLIVLHGPNGAGKTNLLEAISLLTPGRGLRGAKPDALQNATGSKPPWAVAGHYHDAYSDVRLGTGFDPQAGKRIVRINGYTERSQTALAEHLSCVWLTPQMDRLFLESAGSRRRFLDRLIFAFDPGHAGRVTRYDKAMSQRSKLLRTGHERNTPSDPTWLRALEAQMAESGCAIAAARQGFVTRLQQVCDQAPSATNSFPGARLALNGVLETELSQRSALDVEDRFKAQLETARPKDAVTGGAQTGPHKTDLLVTYAAKDMAAEHCSTGEQKALLIGIILAHAQLITTERGTPPLLLLDEVAAHLDESRRAALYDQLQQLGGQVWLTGTDENLFTAVRKKAQFFDVSTF